MSKLLEEIKQILEKLEFKVRFESSTELRRFISKFNRFIINEIVIGKGASSKALKFIDELKEFFSVRGVPEEDISMYLEELSRRKQAGPL